MELQNLFSDCGESSVVTQMISPADLAAAAQSQIAGLRYIPDFVTKQEEADLLEAIDREPWSQQWQRRIQYYGQRYSNNPLHGDTAYTITTLPDWSEPLCARLFAHHIFDRYPNQVGVNEYLPGQGIASHVDYQGGTVVSLSLLSGCVMDFTQVAGDKHISLWLEPRSIVVLRGDARYHWRHGIARRQKDVICGQTLNRARRVSVTVRDILPRPHP